MVKTWSQGGAAIEGLICFVDYWRWGGGGVVRLESAWIGGALVLWRVRRVVWKVDLLWVGESVALHLSRVGSDVEVRFGCDLVMVGVGRVLMGVRWGVGGVMRCGRWRVGWWVAGTRGVRNHNRLMVVRRWRWRISLLWWNLVMFLADMLHYVLALFCEPGIVLQPESRC